MRVLPAQGKLGFKFKQLYPASFGSLKGKPHLGQDILCSVGSAILAPEDGSIIALPNGAEGGLTIWLKGRSGLYHRLMHNSKFLVKVGQQVQAGQRIAVSGNSGGVSTAPHCHWDIDTNGFNANIATKIDPMIWVKGDDMAVSPGTANSALIAAGATNIDPKDNIRLAELWTIGGADKQPEINAIFAKYIYTKQKATNAILNS